MKKWKIAIIIITMLLITGYFLYELNMPQRNFNKNFLFKTQLTEVQRADEEKIKIIDDQQQIYKIISGFKFKRSKQVLFSCGPPDIITFIMPDYNHYMYTSSSGIDVLETYHFSNSSWIYKTKIESDIQNILFSEIPKCIGSKNITDNN